MARDLTSAVAAAANATVVRPRIFYEGEFASGTLNLWSGVGPTDWDGKTWTGAGQMLGIGMIGETSELRAVGFEVSLSGEATAMLSANLGQARQGLPGIVWLGFIDDDGALIADPFKCFEGRFDVPDIVDEGGRAAISARYESRLIDLARVRIRRYTNEDQQIDYPNDKGFEYVPSLQDAQIAWGNGTSTLSLAGRATNRINRAADRTLANSNIGL